MRLFVLYFWELEGERSEQGVPNLGVLSRFPPITPVDVMMIGCIPLAYAKQASSPAGNRKALVCWNIEVKLLGLGCLQVDIDS
jgi:hypothetical protein